MSKEEKITEGKVGETYLVPVDYSGTWRECKGIPQIDEHGRPLSNRPHHHKGEKEMEEVIRPDFRKVNKDDPVF